MEAAETPRRSRPVPELPQAEQQWQRRRRRQQAQRKQAGCSCCARTPVVAREELGPAPTALPAPLDGPVGRADRGDCHRLTEETPLQLGARAGSPADSPPDSPKRALQASPPAVGMCLDVELGLELEIGAAAGEADKPILPDTVYYLGEPTPSPRVVPPPRRTAAPLPFRPPRRQGPAAAPSVEDTTRWALPFTIEAQPGESRNEAISRVVDQRVPGPATPTLGTVGAWDGPLLFGVLTAVVDKYVYNQPWDRVMAAYHWRCHASLDADMQATMSSLEPPDAHGQHTVAYNCSIDMPKVVKIVARCDAYRWVERQHIDVEARCFRSYSSTEMWRDKFQTLEFIEFFAVSETETYMRKGLLADTSGGYPPKWVCEWIAKAYSQRSNDSCHLLNQIADTVGERQCGQDARVEHLDVVRIRNHLRMPPLSKRVKCAKPLWAVPGGFSGK